jgi:fumarate reductase subunit C
MGIITLDSLEETLKPGKQGEVMERGLYRKPISRAWWLKNSRYTLFMLREVSSIFLALFVVLYLVQLALLVAGPELYSRYLALMKTPGWIALHIVILAFAIIHTLTWLSSIPAVQPIRVRGKEAPYQAAWLAGFIAWIAVSVGIGLVILGD